MRKCYKCYEEKNDEEFGKSFFCKECRNEIYFEKNAKTCPVCKKKFLSNGRKRACSNICNIKSNINIDENGCWLWNGILDICGYGEVVDFDIHKKKRVHRLTYEIYKEKLPQGSLVLHKCDTRNCCNPDHLYIGTDKDNRNDAKIRGRMKGLFLAEEEHWNVKLTLEKVKEIKRRFSLGEKAKELAHEFQVHVETIRDILKGRTWKNA